MAAHTGMSLLPNRDPAGADQAAGGDSDPWVHASAEQRRKVGGLGA
jgi:hypothetical protein